MQAVVSVERGVVELNYMWLPTWVGMNTRLLEDLNQHIRPIAVGKALTDEVLTELHEEVVKYLCQRFPAITGLEEYFKGLSAVHCGPAKAGAYV